MENNNLSEFMKLAYKYGKVKDLNEAFEEFPVEDEWNEGYLEKVLKKAEGQIKNGEVIDAEIVFSEMRKKYGY